MKVRTAKGFAGGHKITKVQTWDAIGQEGDEGAAVLRSNMVLRTDTGLYHEDGDIDEDGYRLSEVLRTDMVLAIHTDQGRVFSAAIQTHGDVLAAAQKRYDAKYDS